MRYLFVKAVFFIIVIIVVVVMVVVVGYVISRLIRQHSAFDSIRQCQALFKASLSMV